MNYSIDKHIGHTDPAILEQERQVIAKGKAEIDPRYMEKFNAKFGSSAGSSGFSRKPVGTSTASTTAGVPTSNANDRRGQHMVSELEG